MIGEHNVLWGVEGWRGTRAAQRRAHALAMVFAFVCTSVLAQPEPAQPAPAQPPAPQPPPAQLAEPASSRASAGDSRDAVSVSLNAAQTALLASQPECRALALAALQLGVLSPRQTAQAWLLSGGCDVVMNDADRAQRSFAVALRIDPTSEAPTQRSTEAFARAQHALPAHGLVLRAERSGDALKLTLVDDDLQLAQSASVLLDDQVIGHVPLEVGHASHKISGLDVAQSDALAVTLNDRYGNALVRIAVVDAPPAAAVPTSPRTTPSIITYVGAGVLTAGILAMVASGVGIGVAGSDFLSTQPLLVVGVLVGAAAFVGGGALVVVDQGFDAQ